MLTRYPSTGYWVGAWARLVRKDDGVGWGWMGLILVIANKEVSIGGQV